MQYMFLLRQRVPVVRAAAAIAVPALASLIGIIWFKRRKRGANVTLCVQRTDDSVCQDCQPCTSGNQMGTDDSVSPSFINNPDVFKGAHLTSSNEEGVPRSISASDMLTCSDVYLCQKDDTHLNPSASESCEQVDYSAVDMCMSTIENHEFRENFDNTDTLCSQNCAQGISTQVSSEPDDCVIVMQCNSDKRSENELLMTAVCLSKISDLAVTSESQSTHFKIASDADIFFVGKPDVSPSSAVESETTRVVDHGVDYQSSVLCNCMTSSSPVVSLCDGNELPNNNPSTYDQTLSDDGWASSPSNTHTLGSPKTIASCDANVDVLSEDSGNISYASDRNIPLKYQFYFPTELCGALIGKDGWHINGICRQTGADISIRVQPEVEHMQLVTIEGTILVINEWVVNLARDQGVMCMTAQGYESQVEKALCAIRSRFPDSLYQDVHNGDVIVEPAEIPLSVQLSQLFLAEDSAVDVIVSSVVSADHVFVQQPLHESFRFLQLQDFLMQQCYGLSGMSVPLPRPVVENTLCAAPMFSGWYRAVVIAHFVESDECMIRFVDYGGYARVAASVLQQIRSDFTKLPFQAVESYLTDIIPPIDNLPYPNEAKMIMESIVQSQPLMAQVVGYTDDGTTCINLFRCIDNQMYSVSDELVCRGVARHVWMPPPAQPSQPEENDLQFSADANFLSV